MEEGERDGEMTNEGEGDGWTSCSWPTCSEWFICTHLPIYTKGPVWEGERIKGKESEGITTVCDKYMLQLQLQQQHSVAAIHVHSFISWRGGGRGREVLFLL